MAGYIRQAAADIVPTAIVRAAPINNELNALRDAFAQASGHKHDGTAAEGPYVPLISDTSAFNKVVVDSTNNRLNFFVNVSSAASEQVRISNTVFNPVTTNVFSLGTNALRFKDLFLAGSATIPTLTVTTATISGGSINGTTIGATTPSTGVFTTLTANTSATLASATISGGTINGVVIGGTTPAALTATTINGTTITASTGFVGALSGTVSGSLTGNVTGNVTGDVTGNVTGNLTGNVTAYSGTSTFNNVTINGTLDMNSGTSNTIIGVANPTNAQDAANKTYVDTTISTAIAGIISTGGMGYATPNQVLINSGGNVAGISPGTSGNVLTSDGTYWSSTALPALPTIAAQGFITQATGGNQPPGCYNPSDSFSLI